MSTARDHLGPWLDTSVLGRTAPLRREFDRNRDPLIARQIADLEKTEAQRREESGERHAEKDKPEPALKPQRPMRGDADREGWLIAQRDAAFARAAVREAARDPGREIDRQPHRHSPGPSL